MTSQLIQNITVQYILQLYTSFNPNAFSSYSISQQVAKQNFHTNMYKIELTFPIYEENFQNKTHSKEEQEAEIVYFYIT